MKLIKNFLYCSIIVQASCSNANKQVTIIPLDMLNHTDTFYDRGRPVRNKSDFYLVQNYRDNKETLNYIDSFVRKNMDSGIRDSTHYSIIFYKESGQTNIKNLLANPKVIDRYSQDHDQIYVYSWMNGMFEARYKVKNGKFVEPKTDIKVIDIPQK